MNKDNFATNFDTCINRSETSIVKKVKTCCNNYQDIEGYNCNERNIFPLSHEICNGCDKLSRIRI